MERFLDLSRREEVIEKVLNDWLLRELRDDFVSRLTWKQPSLQPLMAGLRLRADLARPIEVYYLTPMGIGGKLFYEHPVGEALYSAEAHVVVEHESDGVRVVLANGRLFWVGSDEPRGYRISEGNEELFRAVFGSLTRPGARPSTGRTSRTRRESRPRAGE